MYECITKAMFSRFFRNKENLRSTRRRSASCPNLEQASFEDGPKGVEEQNSVETSSDSGSDEKDSANRFERRKAQRSIRRVRQKEKEKKENAEKNLISMDDYLGKLSELKTWLKDERKKDVENMRSPKLKAHFKTFVKLWNKRKLPARFYRTCSVDQENEDTPSSPVYPEVSKQKSLPQYPLMEDPATPGTPIFPPPMDLSADNNLADLDSPFSTFGKTPDDPFSSPAILLNQASETEKSSKEERSIHSNKEGHSSSSNGSPQKFATISRGTPASAALYKFTAQPWSSRGDPKVHPVSSPKCPELPQTPAGIRTLPHNFALGAVAFNADKDKWISGWNRAASQSPVYSAVVDAIPYSTESPKYAEIEESVPLSQDFNTSPGYCSLSPLQEQKTSQSAANKPVGKKPSFNRRRSKSMEDIYAVPVRMNPFSERRQIGFKRPPEVSKTPPIPEKKYSPKVLSSFLGHRDKMPSSNELDTSSNSGSSPTSSTVTSPGKSPTQGSGSQKRRSHDSVDTEYSSTSPMKKTKSGELAQGDRNNSAMEIGSTPDKDDTFSPSKLSILTGSLNPTTRSRYKLNESLKSTDNSIVEENKNSDLELSVLEVQQLDESPKFPRRRLKRRSSSFSTTPGKGLTFGKTSKKAALSTPRRVSFSKDVKDTDGGSTPSRRRSSSRQGNAVQVFKQTEERKEFESFLSSHMSPPKQSNSPSRGPNSPNKVISPIRNMADRIYSPSKQGHLLERVDSNSSLGSCTSSSQGSVRNYNNNLTTFRAASGQSSFRQSPVKTVKNNDEKLFSASSVRQVGRRVIGAPSATSAQEKNAAKSVTLDASPQKTLKSAGNKPESPQKKILNHLKQFSPPKKLFDSQLSLSAPKKTIHTLVSKLSDKTASICANEVSEGEGYSSSDEVLDGRDHIKSTEAKDRSMKNSFTSNSYVGFHNGIDDKLPQPLIMGTDTTAKESETQNVKSSDFEVVQLETSPGSKHKIPLDESQESFSSLYRHMINSEVTNSEENTNNKDVQMDVDQPAFLREEASSPNSSQQSSYPEIALTSENTDGAFESSLLAEITSLVSKKLDMDQSAGLQGNEDGLATGPDSNTLHPPVSEPADVKHRSISPTSKFLAEISDNTGDFRHFSSSTNLDQDNDMFASSGLRAFEKEAKIWNKRISTSTTRGQWHSSSVRSETQVTQSVCTDKDAQKLKSKGTEMSQMLTTPAELGCRDVKQQSTKHDLQGSSSLPNDNSSTAVIDKCHTVSPHKNDSVRTFGVKRHQNESSSTNIPLTSPQISHKSFFVVGIKKSNSVEKKIQEKTPKERACNLDRLESIKASPKVIDNDGWITERRRSSKGKTHSFRSAYNRYLLRSSKEANEEMDTTPPLEFSVGKEEEVTATVSEEHKMCMSESGQVTVAPKGPVYNQGAPHQTNKLQKQNAIEEENLVLSVCARGGEAVIQSPRCPEEKHELLSGPVLKIPIPETSAPVSDQAIPAKPVSQDKTVEDLPTPPGVLPPQKKPGPGPLKPKPAVLPKTFKASTVMAQKRLNVNNFVSTVSNTRRRSSLTKRSESQAKSNMVQKGSQRRESTEHKENYVRKNIKAVRRSSGKGTNNSPVWSQCQHAGQTQRKRSSVGESKDNRRTNQEQAKGDERAEKTHTRKMETLNGEGTESGGEKRRGSKGGKRQDSAGGNRRESLGGKRDSLGGKKRDSLSGKKRDSLSGKKRDSLSGKRRDSQGTGRRRSRGVAAEDENKMPSFSERQQFFQQLQSKTASSPTKSPVVTRTKSSFRKPVEILPDGKLISDNTHPKFSFNSSEQHLSVASNVSLQLTQPSGGLLDKTPVTPTTNAENKASASPDVRNKVPMHTVNMKLDSKEQIDNVVVYSACSKDHSSEPPHKENTSLQRYALRSKPGEKGKQVKPKLHARSPENSLKSSPTRLHSPPKPSPYPKPSGSTTPHDSPTLKVVAAKGGRGFTLSPHGEMKF